jgi:ElaB/YqjD/DUF883 family membrane-anchored ribosome-binding protein
MDDRIDRISRDVERGVRRVADQAGEVTTRAASSIQAVSDRAHGLAAEASDQVERLTGRPVDAWAADIRSYVRAHPLQSVAITIGLGFVLGKLFKRT